ncbi:MAG: hypothetical protein MUF25_11810, partial [Pirellulaceae bacterium]|nr:hypothetical protein [Pirellulaceae bacterium]
MPFRETIRGPQRRPSFVGEYRFAGKRLPGGDGCMAVSRTDGFSDQVRAWLAECLPRAIVYARSLVRDAGEADDVVQECVYRLLRRSATRDDKRHLIVYTKEDSAGTMQQFAARLVDGKSVVAQLKSCEPVNGGCGTFGRSWFT